MRVVTYADPQCPAIICQQIMKGSKEALWIKPLERQG
jgi:hypothetical protein